MSKPDGGPVYPHLMEHCQRVEETEMYFGLSVRDFFAAAALQGIINRGFSELGNSESAYAALSYKLADAMLLERDK